MPVDVSRKTKFKYKQIMGVSSFSIYYKAFFFIKVIHPKIKMFQTCILSSVNHERRHFENIKTYSSCFMIAYNTGMFCRIF